MLSVFNTENIRAAEAIRGADGFYYQSSEDLERFRAWVESLPPYTSDGSKAPPPSSLNWTDHGYVGFPRNQFGCGTCGMFATVGMLEVQHAINCCELDRCPCDAAFTGLLPLHLSTQIVQECSRFGYFNGCADGGPQDFELFITSVGTTFHEYEPFEHAYGMVRFDEPYPNICPLLDRELGAGCLHDPLPPTRPSTFIYPTGKNAVCDLQDYVDLNPTGTFTSPLTFIRAASLADFYQVSPEDLIQTIADGHVVASMISWRSGDLDPTTHRFTCNWTHGIDHYVLIVGYEDNGDTLLIRNSHGEDHLWKVGFGDCYLGETNFAIDNTATYDGCPQDWLDGDEDFDGIPNLLDMCLYSWNKDPSSPITTPPDTDCDGWWENDLTAGFVGCDDCYDYARGIGIKEADRFDEDGDGIGHHCDACPRRDVEDTRYFCYDCSVLIEYGMDRPMTPPSTTCPSDRDGDGICDHCDHCPDDKNLFQADDDEDGVCNACDGCPFLGGAEGAIWCSYGQGICGCTDGDGDFLCNDPECDNCLGVSNPYPQGDMDGDGVGDACDGCPNNKWRTEAPYPGNDADGDGLIDDCDLCPSSNPTGSSDPVTNYIDDKFSYWKEDRDDDYVGDRCDMCPNDPSRSFGNDSDSDGLMDDCDLCINRNPTGTSDPIANAIDDHTINGSSYDSDKDHAGDLCDNCLLTPNRDQFDSDAENWNPSPLPRGDACDTSPAVRFWSLEENAGECGGGVLPSAPRAFIEERGPSITLKLAYTGMVASMPNSTVSMPVKNAFCDCKQYDNYNDCNNRRDCGNDDHNVANPGIDTGSGWLYLLKKRGDGLTRGNVSKSFTRLYSGEDYYGPCPEFPTRFLDWGCFSADSIEWYERSPVGDTNINGDEYLVDSPYGHEMQRFEWAWYEETEIQTNTSPPCDDDSCSANYRIYLHPFSDSNEVNEDAFFHPVSGVATVHAECPPADGDGGSPWPDPIPVPVTEPPLDLPCQEQWECRNIIPGIFTIDHPEIPDAWRYDSYPPDSAVGGLAVAAVDPYRGRIAGIYASSFEEPADVIDTIDFSAALDAVAPQHDVLPAAGADLASGVWIFGGRNLMGNRNDLWHGVPIQDPQSPGGIAYHWTRFSFSQNQTAPSPRGKAALFMDPGSGRLVLFGGKSGAGAADGQETIFSDLWFFDTAGLSWSHGRPRGDIPAGLKDFSVTQGTIRADGQERPFGFLWGGMNANGAFSNDLHMLDLQSGEFHSYSFESGAPPGMTGAALRFDPTSRSIHLFGGFDGQGWHNWLWTFEFQDVAWFLEEEDCFEGTCPHPAATPVLISYDANDKMIVFPGPDPSTTYTVNPEPYFVRSIAGWEASSVREPWMIKGDCDGNGEAEVGWGSRCSTTGLWYHFPGRMTCDTLTRSMLCMQDPLPAVDLYSHRMPGLKVLRPAGSFIFAAKGAHLVSLDGQDPSSLQELDAMVLGGEVRDMELWKGKLIIARDAGLAVVDAGDPSSLVLEREIWTCGKASAVEVTGDTAWFLTPSGVGSVNLEDEGAAVPSSFGLLLPVSWQNWEIIDVDGSFCGDHSFIADEYSWGPERKFEAAFGWGYAAVQNDLIVIRLDDEGLRVESSLRFDSRIEALRLEGNYVYLTLKDGSRPLVDVRDPADPRIAGEHGVADWSSGATVMDGRTYRMTRNLIEIAEVR